MLARLEQLPGVARAEVDRAGDLLRLTLGSDVLEQVVSALRDQGYEADVEPASAGPATWFDRRSVGDLSLIEAGAIAARVVPAFAREHAVSPSDAAALHDAVVAALHRCFTERVPGEGATGAFRQECARSASAAARGYVNMDAAGALGALIDADMSQDHR